MDWSDAVEVFFHLLTDFNVTAWFICVALIVVGLVLCATRRPTWGAISLSLGLLGCCGLAFYQKRSEA